MKFILLIFLVLTSQLNAGSVQQSDRYAFSAAPADSAIVDYLYQQLSENQAMLEKMYRCSLPRAVTICLPRTQREYFDLIGSSVPDWSGGLAIPAKWTIVLRPGTFFDPVEYREVLLHEMGHIYLAVKVDTGVVPLWFNEGLAMLVSGRSFSWNDHIVIGNAVVADKLLSLDEMDRLLVFGLAKAQLAYAQSFLAVQFLIHEYGQEQIGRILDGIAAGGEWDQVFERHTGLGVDQFTGELENYIQHEYRWAFLVQSRNLFWILVVVLFLTGFLAVKMRNRRILKEWDESERI